MKKSGEIFNGGQYRGFATIEDAMATWKKEAQERYKNLLSHSVLCKCECYRKKERISGCSLILPEEIYKNSVKFTSRGSSVKVISPGNINVLLYEDERNNYGIRADLCEHMFTINKDFLEAHLGEKTRKCMARK